MYQEKNMTGLYVNYTDQYEYEHEMLFFVPDEWLAKKAENEFDMSLEEFMDEYNSDDSQAIYDMAVIEGIYIGK